MVGVRVLADLGSRLASQFLRLRAREDTGRAGTDPWPRVCGTLFPSELLFFPEFRACSAGVRAAPPSTPPGKVVCGAGRSLHITVQ